MGTSTCTNAHSGASVYTRIPTKIMVFACLSAPSVKEDDMVTSQDVVACQKAWADAIVKISKVHKEKGDFVATAAEAAGNLYGYGHGTVLFKPTKAAQHPFRPQASDAMSYFVGTTKDSKKKVKGFSEDAGFAHNGGIALAIGAYYFTCATTKDVVKVEYTFGYKRNLDGKIRICLHHSSIPYAVSKK